MIDMFIFKRAIKKVTSNYNARETLRRLESFLDENSPQLVYWLANLFNGQQNSISYAELEAAALAGYEAQIRQWQQEYAKFVNDKLNPMWLLAIGAGAKQFELKHGKSLDDSDFFVKNWLNNHAGQFITNINAETRQAIKSILYYCQDQQMNPKQIAQAIRPTIGLTQQQAIANLRYKEHVKRTLLRDHPRMSEAKAEERAQRAALKYSSQQQRYRAETIARTELAFAYNRGAHESVRQAVANGLMGRCEKVWETAGTQRTCGRCMELNGKVVGFDDKFFDSKFDLGETPPLHPRCRCVIIYREIETSRRNSLQINETNSTISTGGLAGALNPHSERAEEHAIRYYGLVRSMKTDCKNIANNTGFREQDIQRVKNHVFYEEHELYDGEVARFDPSYYMSQSWQRLIEGKHIEERDIILLNHEFIESVFMAEGLNYREAHDKAEAIYNYSIFIEE